MNDPEPLALALEEWDTLIGKHLLLIEAGAEMCERHVKQLLGMPDWETRAMEQVGSAEKLLEQALLRLAVTRQAMKAKPRVN